ncbi:MAG: hypothetical protein WC882_05220 [Candidatus Gracilibacteria bacterium]
MNFPRLEIPMPLKKILPVVMGLNACDPNANHDTNGYDNSCEGLVACFEEQIPGITLALETLPDYVRNALIATEERLKQETANDLAIDTSDLTTRTDCFKSEDLSEAVTDCEESAGITEEECNGEYSINDDFTGHDLALIEGSAAITQATCPNPDMETVKFALTSQSYDGRDLRCITTAYVCNQ